MTTTELRTKSKELVKTLEQGHCVNLIHRSKIVGEIKPKVQEPKIFDAAKVSRIIDKLNFPPLTLEGIEQRYRSAMMKKHG